MRRALLVASVALITVGCSSDPDPRSPNETERAEAMIQTLEDLGFSPKLPTATNSARTTCASIESGGTTREAVVANIEQMNSGTVDGDTWMDAIALYACPEEYTP